MTAARWRGDGKRQREQHDDNDGGDMVTSDGKRATAAHLTAACTPLLSTHSSGSSGEEARAQIFCTFYICSRTAYNRRFPFSRPTKVNRRWLYRLTCDVNCFVLIASIICKKIRALDETSFQLSSFVHGHFLNKNNLLLLISMNQVD